MLQNKKQKQKKNLQRKVGVLINLTSVRKFLMNTQYTDFDTLKIKVLIY